MLLRKNKNILALSFALVLLVLNVITEVINFFQIDSFLLLKSLLIILILFFIKDTNIKLNKIIKILITFWILFFLTNIILNMVNVYQLDRYQSIKLICQSNKQVCDTISTLFFKLKLFRFITLSSYFFSIPIMLLIFLKFNLNKKLKVAKLDFLQKIFFIVLGVFVFSNLFKSFQAIYLSVIQSYQVLDDNYYDRFTFKKGGVSYYGWIRVYSNFVIAQTSEHDRLLVPPQSITYKMEGNINYFRWFMYPRELYHLEDLADEKEVKIDYVVLSAGECDDSLCVWPDYDISKDKIDKIIFINRETQKIETISKVDYKPENFYQKWGLIKLK